MSASGTRASRRAFGSRLLGSPEERGRVVRIRVALLVGVSTVAANTVGALLVSSLVLWGLPGMDVLREPWLRVANLAGVPAYLLIAVVAGTLWGTRRAVTGLAWLAAERAPTEAERREALRAPLHLLSMQAVLWTAGAVLFGVLNGWTDPLRGGKLAFVVLLGGVVTGAHTYLLSELLLRPVAARALAAGGPGRVRVPGVTARTLLAWALGSGVPVAGLMTVAVFALVERDVSPAQLSVTILALGGVTLAVGFGLSLLAARAAVDPIRELRAAFREIERGEFGARVEVFDGTEIGELQAGFNRMAAGLLERERIRDLFGRHVGEDVATLALRQGVELGGEARDVAVLFVDVVGSTTLAATRPPQEVVALLNRFFSVVVDVVTAHAGLVNKFEGDAVLAVFGAPARVDDPRGRALAAARDLAERLGREVPECQAGIGVAAGEAVAGNVGAERRLEYTVIGDPVNEAARLTELAKTVPGGVVASMDVVEGAESGERSRWREQGEASLRGRASPTRLAVPA